MTDPPVPVRVKAAAACAATAGAIWLVVWLHQYHSHGRTTVNEMRLVVGLTWMDAAKVLPFTVLLLLPGLEVVIRRARVADRREAHLVPAVALGRAAQGLLVLAAVSGAVDFWTFPFGTYAETFESRGDGSPLQFIGCALAGVVTVVLAVVRRHAGDVEWAALLVFASGALVSSLWTPVLLWPAIAWTLFGTWLWWSARRRTRASVSTGQGARTSPD